VVCCCAAAGDDQPESSDAPPPGMQVDAAPTPDAENTQSKEDIEDTTPVFAPGMRIILHNLKRDELNGRLGTVISDSGHLPAGQRVPVLLDGNTKPMSILPANLTHVPCPRGHSLKEKTKADMCHDEDAYMRCRRCGIVLNSDEYKGTTSASTCGYWFDTCVTARKMNL